VGVDAERAELAAAGMGGTLAHPPLQAPAPGDQDPGGLLDRAGQVSQVWVHSQGLVSCRLPGMAQ
jgi:hypothetical protein